MSRSRRHTPITAITTAETDKPFKASEHRRERRAVKAALHVDVEPAPSKAFGNPASGEKDGKRYWRDPAPDLLRK